MGKFIRALYDFSFTEFITGKIIKFIYAVGIILIGIILFGVWVTLLIGTVPLGILAAPFLVVGFVLASINYRILLEFIMIVFQINENIKKLAPRSPVARDSATVDHLTMHYQPQPTNPGDMAALS